MNPATDLQPDTTPQQETDPAPEQPTRSGVRISLHIKYSLIFGGIFLTVLYSMVSNLFEEEKRDLERLSHQQFTAIFNTIAPNAAEALSVGEADKLALKASLDDLIRSGIPGLERIRVIKGNGEIYLEADTSGTRDTGDRISEIELKELEGKSRKPFVTGDLVYLTRKIDYETAVKTVFLGYIQLSYSLKPINDLIAAKEKQTYLTGTIAFLISVLIVIGVTMVLVRRIKLLHAATRQIEAGEFPEVPVKGNDELGELTRSFNIMTQAVKERLMMSKYVSESTIEAIRKQNPVDQQLGGQRSEQCFFFSDIRGFTAFSEKSDPDRVVRYLNDLLNRQVEIIRDFQGDIDKFVGDEVMAVFKGNQKEARAVSAAIRIQQAMNELADSDPVYKELRIGIGIHSGEVVSGNIGSRDRMDYTSIGDTVNTSARMCSAAAAGEILISEVVRKSIDTTSFRLGDPFSVPMKNKKEQLVLYKVQHEKN